MPGSVSRFETIPDVDANNALERIVNHRCALCLRESASGLKTFSIQQTSGRKSILAKSIQSQSVAPKAAPAQGDLFASCTPIR